MDRHDLLPLGPGWELTQGEERLVACAASGEEWRPRLPDGVPHGDDPANVDRWTAERDIRPDVVQCLATGTKWSAQTAPWPIHAKGLQLRGARITADLDLHGCDVLIPLQLRFCVIQGAVILTDARTRFISFDHTHVRAIDARHVRIAGSLQLRNKFRAQGPVNISGAHIEGQLTCADGYFANPGKTALDANRLTVEGSVFLHSGFHAAGKVDLRDANIGGQLDCMSGRFDQAGGVALDAGGANVGANVNLGGSFLATGKVSLLRATIGGQLACEGGRFNSDDEGIALDGTALSLAADAFLSDGFHAKGEVSLLRATIGGQLNCSRGIFENAGGIAIHGEALTVGSDVFLQHVRAIGEVNFVGASIARGLLCQNAVFDNAGACAMDLNSAAIGAGLEFAKVGRLEGNVDLGQTRVRTFLDDRSAWPKSGDLYLDGFTYEHFSDSPTGSDVRLAWLALQKEAYLKGDFRPQPWGQLIKVLREMGHDEDARNIAVRRAHTLAQRPGTQFHMRWWSEFLRLAVGYGYRPERALYWSFAFFLLGWLTFAAAANLGYMAPREAGVVTYLAASPGAPLPEHYTRFNAVIYAIDLYLPVIELGQDTTWEPSDVSHGGIRPLPDDEGGSNCAKRLLLGQNSQWEPPAAPAARSCGYAADSSWVAAPARLADYLFRHGVHRLLYWLEEIAGWIFVSLYIAGMSGIMKKE